MSDYMNDRYKGYREITVTDDEIWNSVYSHPENNIFDCCLNEYIVLQPQSGGEGDKLKWTSRGFKKLNYKTINNTYINKIKPRNVQQELAFDLLQDNETTVKLLTGRFGSGKTMLMVVNALQALELNKFEKIVWVRNNINVKNTKELGALPGTEFEKLLPYVMPLADHVGGIDGIDLLMRRHKLEVQHLGFIRGRDIKNSIIFCSEAENLTTHHIQLLLGRVGEGSNLWLDGDLKQRDGEVFENSKGLETTINKLKGNHLFGYVHLEKSERSETANLADLLD